MDYIIERITNTAFHENDWFTAEQLEQSFRDDTRASILAIMLRSTDTHATNMARELGRNIQIIQADARDYIIN